MSEVRELERLLTQGKISRREFLARLSALGIAATLSPALLSGLAGAATPKKGGRLRMGVTGGSTHYTLDPAPYTSTMVININWQYRQNLVEIDDKAEAIPELAESWESTPDAKKWIFKIRKGVEFHNGKTLDAEDVIYSINHHRGEDSKSGAKALLNPVKEIKADGKHTVVFTMESGNADFPFLLADYHLVVVPAGSTGDGWRIGTGGYILEEYESGVRALVKRNPNYWKEGRAHFDEVETIHIADLNARMNALKTGQVDVISRCDLKTVKFLEKVPGIQIVRTTGFMHYTIPMSMEVPPYDNNDVRLALKYAIDREDLLNRILRGYGAVGNDHPIAPGQRYYASELPQRKYDPDKARYHIKKAGLEGHTFQLHVSDAPFPGCVDAAVLYKEYAAKAGITIEVVQEPVDGYWNNVWMKKPWCFSYWSGRPTEDWMFSVVYAADAKWNECHGQHARFNELLVAARAELDQAKRREMYVEMQKIVRDEWGNVIPLFADHVVGASDKLRFGKISPVRELDDGRLAERWWFA